MYGVTSTVLYNTGTRYTCVHEYKHFLYASTLRYSEPAAPQIVQIKRVSVNGLAMIGRRAQTPWPEMGADSTVEWLSSTVLRAEDEEDGREVAEVLLERVTSLCHAQRANFEDPDFGPDLSDQGQLISDEFLQLLEEELPPGIFQDVARSVEMRQKKGLREPGGADFLPSGPLSSDDLVWRSGNGGGTVVIKAASGTSAMAEVASKHAEVGSDAEGGLPSPARTVLRKGSSVISPVAVASYPVQGALGDRWLLGAMSVIVDSRPRLLREMFVATPPPDGSDAPEIDSLGPVAVSARDVYVVRLYHDFSWHFVLIDGRIPTHARSKNPAFGHCSDPSETWVALVEKAAAKLFGSYAALHLSGCTEAGMHLMTGCPTHTVRVGGFGRVVAGPSGRAGGSSSTRESKDSCTSEQEQKEVIDAVRSNFGESGSINRKKLFQQLVQFVDAGFLIGCEKRVALQHNVIEKRIKVEEQAPHPTRQTSSTQTDSYSATHTLFWMLLKSRTPAIGLCA